MYPYSPRSLSILQWGDSNQKNDDFHDADPLDIPETVSASVPATPQTRSTHRPPRTPRLHPQLHKQIMAGPPCPQPLPKHIHRYRKQTKKQRCPTKDEHDLLGTRIGNLSPLASLTPLAGGTYPIISKITQPIEHKVLEQHVHHKDFIALAPKAVQPVAQC
jgi:hypothetical protein